MSGGLALLRAFCQWKIELCVKGLILRNMAGRKRDAGRLYESGYKKRMKKRTGKRNYLNLQTKQKIS